MPSNQQTEEKSKNELYECGVAGVQSGQYSSSYSAAKLLGISRRTLDQQIKGTQPRTSAHAEQQNLSEVEEKCSCQMDYHVNNDHRGSFIFNY